MQTIQNPENLKGFLFIFPANAILKHESENKCKFQKQNEREIKLSVCPSKSIVFFPILMSLKKKSR